RGLAPSGGTAVAVCRAIVTVRRTHRATTDLETASAMTAPALKFEHKQQQTLTPRLQQAVRLLQLSSLDFAQEVHAALDKNPFLEPDDSDGPMPSAADAAPEGATVPDAASEAAAGDDTWSP